MIQYPNIKSSYNKYGRYSSNYYCDSHNRYLEKGIDANGYCDWDLIDTGNEQASPKYIKLRLSSYYTAYRVAQKGNHIRASSIGVKPIQSKLYVFERMPPPHISIPVRRNCRSASMRVREGTTPIKHSSLSDILSNNYDISYQSKYMATSWARGW